MEKKASRVGVVDMIRWGGTIGEQAMMEKLMMMEWNQAVELVVVIGLGILVGAGWVKLFEGLIRWGVGRWRGLGLEAGARSGAGVGKAGRERTKFGRVDGGGIMMGRRTRAGRLKVGVGMELAEIGGLEKKSEKGGIFLADTGESGVETEVER